MLRSLLTLALLFAAAPFLWLIATTPAFLAARNLDLRQPNRIVDPVLPLAIRAIVGTGRQQCFPMQIVDARQALHPLDASLFASRGLAAACRHDRAQARRLLGEALRRNPRLRDPRIWMMFDALARADYKLVVRDADRLYVLDPGLRSGLVQMLAGLTREPLALDAMARRIIGRPMWRTDLLFELNRRGADPKIVYQLTATKGSAADDSSIDEQSSLIRSLVERGDYKKAYLAWVNLLPEALLGKVGYVYDPEFAGLEGAQPFNWLLLTDGRGTADIEEHGGLHITYFGESAGRLAEQTILLPAGNYILRTVTGPAQDPNKDDLSWVVTCYGKVEALTTMLIPRSVPFDRRTLFTVPPSCPAQRLSLVGTPAEFPAPSDVTVRLVSITRAGTR